VGCCEKQRLARIRRRPRRRHVHHHDNLIANINRTAIANIATFNLPSDGQPRPPRLEIWQRPGNSTGKLSGEWTCDGSWGGNSWDATLDFIIYEFPYVGLFVMVISCWVFFLRLFMRKNGGFSFGGFFCCSVCFAQMLRQGCVGIVDGTEGILRIRIQSFHFHCWKVWYVFWLYSGLVSWVN
jgi:hypothetical protein